MSPNHASVDAVKIVDELRDTLRYGTAVARAVDRLNFAERLVLHRLAREARAEREREMQD